MTDSAPEIHQLRVHPRARSVKLRVDAHGRLIVTVPPRFDRRRLPGLIRECGPWIADRREAAKSRKDAEAGALPGGLPTAIHLRALERSFSLLWRPESGAKGVSVFEQEEALILKGDLRSAERCRRVLRSWVVEQGRKTLPPWLEQVSGETGLRFSTCGVGRARTRWGCCQRSGRILLSARLLFLPPHLVRHVMVHELCHTVHPDHSASFWRLVRSFDPDCDRRLAEMREAQSLVPVWMKPGPDEAAFPDSVDPAVRDADR